jgi:hypothetical protein
MSARSEFEREVSELGTTSLQCWEYKGRKLEARVAEAVAVKRNKKKRS